MSAKTDFSRAKKTVTKTILLIKKRLKNPWSEDTRWKEVKNNYCGWGKKSNCQLSTEKERNYTIVILRFTKNDLMKAATDLQMLFN